MKLLKKILCFSLLLTASIASFQANAYENSARCDETPLNFNHWENGTVVVVSGTHRVFNDKSQIVDQYYPGESFYYDRVYSSTKNHNKFFFASYYNRQQNISCVNTSYVNHNGVKTYVPGLTIY